MEVLGLGGERQEESRGERENSCEHGVTLADRAAKVSDDFVASCCVAELA